MGMRPCLLVLAFAASPLLAQKIGEEAPELTWTATHNFGDIPAKKLSELRGSVVLLEFVSVRQATAREELGKLTKLFTELAEQGLVVVTVTSEPAEDVAKWVKRTEIKRPVAVGFNKDYDVNGVPDAFLIDKDGKLLWHGHPSGLERPRLDLALRDARPAIVLPGLEDAQAMRRSKDFGATWRKAKELLDGGGLSDGAKAQAKDWMQQYEQFVQTSLAAADKAVAANDPYGQWVALQPVADWYQGVPGADAGKKRFDALMADPKNKREIEAGKKFAAAKEKEAACDFDGAYAIFREVSTTFGTTKVGKEAASLVKAYEKDGKLGYDNTCGYCKAGGVACPQHRKKKK